MPEQTAEIQTPLGREASELGGLLACPFCGGTDLSTKEMTESIMHPGNYFPEHVSCRKCKVGFTGSKAFSSWNKRTQDRGR